MNRKLIATVLLIICFSFSLHSLGLSNVIGVETRPSSEELLSLYSIGSFGKETDSSIKVVAVNYDGQVRYHLSRSSSALQALLDMGYEISNKNKIRTTFPQSLLLRDSYILVETYRTTIEEVVLTIPFETIIKGNVLCKSLAEEVTEQEGVLGVTTQKIEKLYKGNLLIREQVVEEIVEKETVPRIIVITGPEDLPESVIQRGYACSYWEGYIDNIEATAEEKNWLKFVMRWESGCNAENNKAFFKGLFQWNPCLWYKQYPHDNIFDGEAQVRRTLEKLRDGADPNKMWPAVHKKYIQQFGELSWLQ